MCIISDKVVLNREFAMLYDESADQNEIDKAAENGTNGHADGEKTVVFNFGSTFEATITEGTILNTETGTVYKVSQTAEDAYAKAVIVNGLGRVVFVTSNGLLTPEALAAAKASENNQKLIQETQKPENGQVPVQYKSHRDRIIAKIMAQETERLEAIRIHGDPVEELANLFAHLPPEPEDLIESEENK
jgi:hypothetical protein